MKQLLKCLILVSLIATLCSLPAHTGPPKPKTEAKLTSPKSVAKAAPAVAATTPAVAAAPIQAAPAPAVVVPPTPVSDAIGWQTYVPLIKQYNWPVSTAVAIMRAESGGDPGAVSPLNRDGLRDYGLMQLHGIDILNPAENVAYAYYHKYLPAGGFTPWSTYKDGAYIKYLQ